MINKKNKNWVLLILLFGIIFLFNAVAVSAERNLTMEEQAALCLPDSEDILNELLEHGFNIERVNDTLKTAYNLYEGQLAIKEKNQKYDFSSVLIYCDEIKSIKEIAYIAKDEFDALYKFYNESFDFEREIDIQSIETILGEIENEIESERYEKVPPLVDKAYQEIVEVQAEQTTLNVFYENTKRGLKRFFEKNWIFLISFIALSIVLFFVYRNGISKWIIKRKIQELKLRRETLKKIIQGAQKDYFQDGKISEGTFNIKTKKIAELIRDIDRQIPMLYEELVKVGKGKLNTKEDNLKTISLQNIPKKRAQEPATSARIPRKDKTSKGANKKFRRDK